MDDAFQEAKRRLQQKILEHLEPGRPKPAPDGRTPAFTWDEHGLWVRNDILEPTPQALWARAGLAVGE